MQPDQIAWLAGLLEGEGCFHGFIRNGTISRGAVLLAMADRDVIERAALLMGGKVRVAKKGPHKESFGVGVYGMRARSLMIAVLPYMGQRRSRRIKELLAVPTWGFPDSVLAAHRRSGTTTRSLTMGEAEMIRRIFSTIRRGPRPIARISQAYRRSHDVIRHLCAGHTYAGGNLESRKS